MEKSFLFDGREFICTIPDEFEYVGSLVCANIADSEGRCKVAEVELCEKGLALARLRSLNTGKAVVFASGDFSLGLNDVRSDGSFKNILTVNIAGKEGRFTPVVSMENVKIFVLRKDNIYYFLEVGLAKQDIAWITWSVFRLFRQNSVYDIEDLWFYVVGQAPTVFDDKGGYLEVFHYLGEDLSRDYIFTLKEKVIDK